MRNTSNTALGMEKGHIFGYEYSYYYSYPIVVPGTDS